MSTEIAVWLRNLITQLWNEIFHILILPKDLCQKRAVLSWQSRIFSTDSNNCCGIDSINYKTRKIEPSWTVLNVSRSNWVNIRPQTVLDFNAPLILILAGSQPETTFSCQLLSHAIEAASSVALAQFIQPHCRVGSGRVRLNCSSAAALTDFVKSLYAHLSSQEVDCFIRDHVIDETTLQLAESFAIWRPS